MANTANFAIEKATVGGYRNTWGGTVNTGMDKIDELLALAMPVGTIQMYPLATAPTATTNGGTWLVCQGQSLLNTLAGGYKPLYDIIGNTYGSADSTHFNLPDLRSRVPVGYNVDTISGRSTRAIAEGSGTESHTLLDAEIPKHAHPITDVGHIHPIADQTHFHTGSNDGGTADASLAVTDPGHNHRARYNEDWVGGSAVYSLDWGPGAEDSASGALHVDSNTTGITIPDHKHSFTSTTDSANISTTGTNAAGFITTTNETATGDGAHNIMQPYLVVNYIILAKHPTF